MKALPIVIIILLFFGANFYVFYRLWQMMPVNTIARVALVAAGVVAVSSLFVYFLFADSLPALLLGGIYKLGTSWIFIFIYLLMAVLLADVIRMTHLFGLEKYLSGNWVGFFTLTGTVAVIMVLGNIKYHHKERVELNLSVDRKGINEEQTLKIVALSDLHLGYGIGRNELAKWVKLINAEQADMVLIAGDLIDNSVRPLYEQDMAEVLREIKSTYGVYACAGNHEYIANLQKSMECIDEANIHLLRDSAMLIDNRFYVLGRDDRANPNRQALNELVARLDPSKPIIMLDHQPYHLEQAEENNIDLQVSGHTHRGQVWPINWITDAIYEVSHGYKKKGNSHIYVSSGIGLWGGKFRIGSQSEYVVINLKF